ncbi:uncharacterized protein LOC116012765 [Ipomoea triloba]|uniref:uncharacterized protein LOC116012765 n=1 Tax=Ipomoea triloba TaxID=35885 RepID=UPI00125E3F92|nr:uncharacterized protein LOC116012765 [Ipomoea triloba]
MATLAVHGGYLPSKFQLWRRTVVSEIRPNPPSLFITTKLSDIDIHRVRDLYSDCNHSCHRFPNLDADGRVDPVDLNKLRKALIHSSVVVSVFTQPEFSSPLASIGGDWVRTAMPVTPANGQLVGFGRAVSDSSLTASIYDVMVIPPLRRRGIGRRIVQMILRMLTNKGIYDIAALCSDVEKPFFSACGFGDDILGSTTMMYTRSTSQYSSGDQVVKNIGRKQMLIPPLRAGIKS